jgi:phospholipase/carboxylesterase
METSSNDPTTDARALPEQWRGSDDPAAPLVVLLHGRGSDEREIIDLADELPAGLAYAAVRGGVALDEGGFAWFERGGIGRPTPASLREQMDRFRAWLDRVAPPGRPVVLIGFSGGAAFAGGLALDDPARYAGVAVLYGTLPFDAGVPTTPDRLDGLQVFHAQALGDFVIPRDLQDRTWDYLLHDAGTDNVTHRHPGGHEITPAVLGSLRVWVARVTGTTP